MDIQQDEYSLFDEILILSTLIIIFVLFDDKDIKITLGFTLFLIILIRYYFQKKILLSLVDTIFLLFYSTFNIFILFLCMNLFEENFWFNLYYWFIPFLSAFYIILRSMLKKITSFSKIFVLTAFVISSIFPLCLLYLNLILIYGLAEKYLINDYSLSKVQIEEIQFLFSFFLMLIPFFYSLCIIFKNKIYSNFNINSLLILYVNQIVISIGMSTMTFWFLDGFS